jgi:hypothetical protein
MLYTVLFESLLWLHGHEDGDTAALRNFINYLPVDTVSKSQKHVKGEKKLYLSKPWRRKEE